jgi:MFS family permease
MRSGSLCASLLVALTWAITPGVAVTLVLFAMTSLVVALRMVAGTVYGFELAGEQAREVGMVRAASTQLGYLAGSLAGGAALALGGFHLLAVAFGGLFLGSTLPYVRRLPRLRPVIVATPQGDAV